MSVYGLIVRNRRTARRRERAGMRCADLARLQGCNVDRAAWDDAYRDAQRIWFDAGSGPLEGTRADVHSVRADVLETEAALYGAWNGGAS